jgi:hypothetical protein
MTGPDSPGWSRRPRSCGWPLVAERTCGWGFVPGPDLGTIIGEGGATRLRRVENFGLVRIVPHQQRRTDKSACSARYTGMPFAKGREARQPRSAAVEVSEDPAPQREDHAVFSSVHIRPLKIVCDAPPYEVVKASERVGMRSPEDVRWRRQGIPIGAAAGRSTVVGRLWRLLFAFGLPEVEETCGCGSILPERRSVRLRTLAGSEIRYTLTQCGRCRTIVWDKEQTSAGSRAARRRGND